MTSTASTNGPSPARPAAGRRLFVTSNHRARAMAVAIAAALLLWPAYADTSLWLGLGVAICAFVLVHGAAAAYQVPWLPGIITAGACLQWVLAPWLVYHAAGKAMRVAPMAVDAPRYFAFAVPATLAFVAGIYAPLWRLGTPRRAAAATGQGASRLRKACETMVGAGIAVRLVVLPFAPASLKFALYLVALLAFVGALALAIMQTPGWYWRIVAVVGVSAISSAAELQFLELLLWCACIGVVLCYRYRPRATTILAFAGPALLLFTALNAFKTLYRDSVREMSLESGERAAVTTSTVWELTRDPSTALGQSNLYGTLSRLNEGSIISRILVWVPAAEPYAHGETILTALRSAFVPRVFDSDKYVAGGSTIVPRFTGMTLIKNTSVGLSIPGEMYGNFGALGAVVATFVVGMLLGWLFKTIFRRAQAAPVWWAWAPFILFGALSAEQNVAETLNSLSKAILVMWVVTRFVPAWRAVPRRVRSGRAPFRPASPLARPDEPLEAVR